MVEHDVVDEECRWRGKAWRHGHGAEEDVAMGDDFDVTGGAEVRSGSRRQMAWVRRARRRMRCSGWRCSSLEALLGEVDAGA